MMFGNFQKMQNVIFKVLHIGNSVFPQKPLMENSKVTKQKD